MTVYLDSVFALNFAVNWLLLRAAARLGAAAVRAPAHRGGCGARRSLRRGGVSAGVRSSGGLGGQACHDGGAAGRGLRPAAGDAAARGGVRRGDAGAVRRGIRAGAAEARPRAPRRAVVPRNVLVARADGGRGLCRDTPAAAPTEPRAGQRRARAADARRAAGVPQRAARQRQHALRPRDGRGRARGGLALRPRGSCRTTACAPRILPRPPLWCCACSGSTRASSPSAPSERAAACCSPCRARRSAIGKSVQKNGLVAFSPTPVSDGGGYEALTGGKCDA